MKPQIAERSTRPTLRLTAADHGRRLSLEEFFAADYEEGYRYELIHGRLEVSPLANQPHERLRKWLERQLDRYAELHPEIFNEVSGPGRLILAEPDEEAAAPEPDLLCRRDFPGDLSENDLVWEQGTPILVVEIISPDNADKDTERNVGLYLKVPTIREYWIIDPREDYDCPKMTVYRRRGNHWQKPIEVKAAGTYPTKLLPGFTLNLDRGK